MIKCQLDKYLNTHDLMILIIDSICKQDNNTNYILNKTTI